MAKESSRVKSEAGKAMHSKNKVTRSLAGGKCFAKRNQNAAVSVRQKDNPRFSQRRYPRQRQTLRQQSLRWSRNLPLCRSRPAGCRDQVR